MKFKVQSGHFPIVDPRIFFSCIISVFLAMVETFPGDRGHAKIMKWRFYSGIRQILLGNLFIFVFGPPPEVAATYGFTSVRMFIRPV